MSNVEKGSRIYTDDFRIYRPLSKIGYSHSRIRHSHRVYVSGDVHTNTIEGFWALVKNGIRGVYHSVSPEYLQNYLDEYVYRYNHRDDITPMFFSFLRQSAVPMGD